MSGPAKARKGAHIPPLAPNPYSPPMPVINSPAPVEPVVQFSVEDLATALKVAWATSKPPTHNTPSTEPQTNDRAVQQEKRRGPKAAFDTVDEVWDYKSSRYKIVSSNSTVDSDDADDYAFVARRKIDRSGTATVFIDVKSKTLLECLEMVFNDVKSTGLREEKPTVERKLLYHYIQELCSYKDSVNDLLAQKHLTILLDYLNRSCALLKERVDSLLATGEITFTLLWTIFKPNEIIYGKCPGTDKPRCIMFNSGEVKKLSDGTEYYHIEGRYLDFNGESVGESTTAFGIIKFPGAKRIDSLDAFPLNYHPDSDAVRRELAQCGHKFLELVGMHHKEYRGVAFFKKDDRIKKVFVEGRIMVDAAQFFEVDPNYTKPRFDDHP